MYVFLATKNHISARTISRSILMTTATKICIVWLSDSFFNPLLKTYRDKIVIAEKHKAKTPASLRMTPVFVNLSIKNAVIRTVRSRSSIPNKYFFVVTRMNYFLIKSLIAEYMPAKTPSSERIMVNTGVDNSRYLSSLTPHQVITPIMTIIWNAMLEYFPKFCSPLFSGLFGRFFWFFCF